MTEWSAIWTTNASPSGHQETSYTQAHWSTIAEIMAACGAFEGVAPDYLNDMVGSVPAVNTFRIGTGGLIGDGKVYKNDAAEDVNIPSAVGGGNTRIDRIVVRFTWASFEGVIYRIAGTDAASPTVPAYTKTSGTTYDILLYQVLVDTSGNVSIVLDEREWAGGAVDDVTIEISDGELQVIDASITMAKLASAVTDQFVTNGDAHNHEGGDGGAIGAGAITNRTRKFFVSADISLRAGTSTYYMRGTYNLDDSMAGVPMPDTIDTEVGASFMVPEDFVSGMTVSAVVIAANSGNFFGSMEVYYGEPGVDAWDEYSVEQEDQTVAMTAGQPKAILTINMSDAEAGMVASLELNREGAVSSDTINGHCFLQGWVVEYTADS